MIPIALFKPYYLTNLFQPDFTFLYPLKASKTQRFSDFSWDIVTFQEV